MTPALLVEYGSETFRRLRCAIIVAHVALGTWHAGAAAAASVLAFPWLFSVVLAHPAAVFARWALHSASNPIGSVRSDDMGYVDQGAFRLVAVKGLAARTASGSLGSCDGKRSPRSHIAYFLAVQSRSCRHA
jgi:hypothetical protein